MQTADLEDAEDGGPRNAESLARASEPRSYGTDRGGLSLTPTRCWFHPRDGPPACLQAALEP